MRCDSRARPIQSKSGGDRRAPQLSAHALESLMPGSDGRSPRRNSDVARDTEADEAHVQLRAKGDRHVEFVRWHLSPCPFLLFGNTRKLETQTVSLRKEAEAPTR